MNITTGFRFCQITIGCNNSQSGTLRSMFSELSKTGYMLMLHPTNTISKIIAKSIVAIYLPTKTFGQFLLPNRRSITPPSLVIFSSLISYAITIIPPTANLVNAMGPAPQPHKPYNHHHNKPYQVLLQQLLNHNILILIACNIF